jgi:toxin ParE1/3/4
MRQYRLSAAAESDLIEILAWTQEQLGDLARTRYEALLVAALRDIALQPDRPGSIERPELGAGVRSWHLRLSRSRGRRTEAGKVVHPRHFLIYRTEPDLVLVGRVLHDAMELNRHLDPESSWQ